MAAAALSLFILMMLSPGRCAPSSSDTAPATAATDAHCHRAARWAGQRSPPPTSVTSWSVSAAQLRTGWDYRR